MGRWTQDDEVGILQGFVSALFSNISRQDGCRLPEGVIRIGYDADTGIYTFRDEEGTIYTSSPYERYGYLTPVKPSSPEDNIYLLPRNSTYHHFNPPSHLKVLTMEKVQLRYQRLGPPLQLHRLHSTIF